MLSDYDGADRFFKTRLQEVKAIAASNPGDPLLRTIGQMIGVYDTQRADQADIERRMLTRPPRTQEDRNLAGKFKVARYLLGEQFKRAVGAKLTGSGSRYERVLRRALANDPAPKPAAGRRQNRHVRFSPKVTVHRY